MLVANLSATWPTAHCRAVLRDWVTLPKPSHLEVFALSLGLQRMIWDDQKELSQRCTALGILCRKLPKLHIP